MKLVRDKMPEIKMSESQRAQYGETRYRVADDKEYWLLLKNKLLEEAQEFADALPEHRKQELGDLFEVIDAIIAHERFDKEEILRLQAKKKEERGGFSKRIIWEKATPEKE